MSIQILDNYFSIERPISNGFHSFKWADQSTWGEHSCQLHTRLPTARKSLTIRCSLLSHFWEKKQGELAYAVGYQVEGKGYMTETVKALSNWAFTEHQFKTLQIISHKTNAGSIRVAEKSGFTWQKVLIAEHTPSGENPLDMEFYELYF